MEKLYYRDRKQREAKARVLEILDLEEGMGLILDKTIFFPGGGGQAEDRGSIVYEGEKLRLLGFKDETIHLVERNNKIKEGVEITLELDWKHRLDGMAQHSAQHILSGCFFSMLKRNTKALHIGKEVSQLDIEGIFSEDEVFAIEKMANEVITEGIEIEHYILEDRDRANAYTRRPLPNTQDDIRILKIGDLDQNACCGVHMNNTMDVGLIKIKRYYKHKDHTRFEFLAGSRARDYILNRDNVFSKVLEDFNSGEENILKSIEKLRTKKDELYEERKYSLLKCVNSIGEALINRSSENKDGILLVKENFIGEEDFLIQELGRYIADNYRAIVIFANEKKGQSFVYLQCNKALAKEFNINLGKDFKQNAGLIGIKGGGSPFQAQGKYDGQKNIDIFIDTIYSIYNG